MTELDKKKPTKAKLRSVIVKVARWKALVDVLQTDDDVVKIEKMERQLKDLMAALGAQVKSPATKSGKLALLHAYQVLI